ncbi:MAG: CBU_0592 family membrane protein [Longimicrobiales bacterium]
MLLQVISMIGATLILGAYVANQKGWSGPTKALYNASNLAGALLLGWVAVADQRMGFILLEAVWAIVSIPPLFKSLRVTGTPA